MPGRRKLNRSEPIITLRLHSAVFEISSLPAVLGSGENHADILLRDRTISPQHCRLGLYGDKVTIEDLGSLTGTTVDRYRLDPGILYYIESGQIIVLGRIRMKIEIHYQALRVYAPASEEVVSVISADDLEVIEPEMIEIDPGMIEIIDTRDTEGAALLNEGVSIEAEPPEESVPRKEEKPREEESVNAGPAVDLFSGIGASTVTDNIDEPTRVIDYEAVRRQASAVAMAFVWNDPATSESDYFIIDRIPFIVGRAGPDLNHIIHDKGVSKRHFYINYRDGNYFIADIYSTNGVSINGILIPPLAERVIQEGDVIGVGHRQYRFRRVRK